MNYMSMLPEFAHSWVSECLEKEKINISYEQWEIIALWLDFCDREDVLFTMLLSDWTLKDSLIESQIWHQEIDHEFDFMKDIKVTYDYRSEKEEFNSLNKEYDSRNFEYKNLQYTYKYTPRLIRDLHLRNNKGGIDIHRATLEEFTHPMGLNIIMATQEFCDKHAIAEAPFLEKSIIESSYSITEISPTNVSGFSVGHIGDNEKNGIMCIWDDETGKVVGGQCSATPYIKEEYRGLKLGREIQIYAFENGLKSIDDSAFFSEGGLASRRSAHRFCVERALKNGLEVTDEVLQDYPELKSNPKIHS